jgi:hypothetical protein
MGLGGHGSAVPLRTEIIFENEYTIDYSQVIVCARLSSNLPLRTRAILPVQSNKNVPKETIY